VLRVNLSAPARHQIKLAPDKFRRRRLENIFVQATGRVVSRRGRFHPDQSGTGHVAPPAGLKFVQPG
jgi:hypothetical protein